MIPDAEQSYDIPAERPETVRKGPSESSIRTILVVLVRRIDAYLLNTAFFLMFDQKAKTSNRKFLLLPSSQRPRQHRLMIIALGLLMASLGLVLYSNRDFWFPEPEEAADQPLESTPRIDKRPSTERSDAIPRRKVRTSLHSTEVATAPQGDPVPPTTVTRTVLPPLEIEVVAGSMHQIVRPETKNSVNVDLQPDDQPAKPADPPVTREVVAANIATNAADRSAVSPVPEVVSHSVQPGYPLLARQMNLQGAVTLQALISRDGLIQNLNVVSGPPILAAAAREAVKQWHFKPHYAGGEAVETEAKITVNFTISTN
jgi:TonB family protein